MLTPLLLGVCLAACACAQVNKQTSELVFDHLHATAFQHSPLGRTILGPEQNIRTINRQDLVEYMNTHYRCVLGCSNGVFLCDEIGF
jgi:processing peptidase subunit beta